MFKVKDTTGNIYTVYDIYKERRPSERRDIVLFLVCTECGNWVYIDANDFKPLN